MRNVALPVANIGHLRTGAPVFVHPVPRLVSGRYGHEGKSTGLSRALAVAVPMSALLWVAAATTVVTLLR